MNTWRVEIIDPLTLNGRSGGPRRPSLADEITADELSVDAGTLIFKTAGVVTRALSAGTWAGVALVPAAE